MSKRSRWFGFGSAGLLVLAGGVCAALSADETGQVLALGLIGIGLVAAISLGFLEIGLAEDRDRSGEASGPAAAPARAPTRAAAAKPADRARLDRMRGQTRRLR